MENQTNPLKNYFRKPGIFVKLPSQGKFYSEKPKELNDMGEIPIYPMTAKDELMLKNADALLNGSAIYKLINSCAPTITDVENMPSVDLDAILLAIRRCSYGSSMDVTAVHDCEDQAQTECSVNLDHFISSIKLVEDSEAVDLEDIKVYIKPISVKSLLHLNWIQYEQIRNLQIAEQKNTDEKTKITILQNSYEMLTNENISIVAECIDTVLLPDGTTVTDKNNIKEWVSDLDNTKFKKIETAIGNLGESGMDKKFKVVCSKCGEEYENNLNLNPTVFFE